MFRNLVQAAGLLVLAFPLLAAAELVVRVSNPDGSPVPGAAVFVESTAARAAAAASATATIEQRDKRFQPKLLVVRRGTAIDFPNNDTVRHHVYSFSPAKTFEIRLYIGQPAAPVVFDKLGTVVLGCNIHDQMVGFIHVVDTPWHGVTDAQGVARLPEPSSGAHRLKVWHPTMGQSGTAHEQALTWPSTGQSPVSVQLSRPMLPY